MLDENEIKKRVLRLVLQDKMSQHEELTQAAPEGVEGESDQEVIKEILLETLGKLPDGFIEQDAEEQPFDITKMRKPPKKLPPPTTESFEEIRRRLIEKSRSEDSSSSEQD